jgi:tungstate transport system substrate-binding protein
MGAAGNGVASRVWKGETPVRRIFLSVLPLVAVLLAAACGGGSGEPAGSAGSTAGKRLRVATTTSLYDTGLWGVLEPLFEETEGVELDVMYAGTGRALEWGRNGDVDVITVHSPAREEEFVADGWGIERVPFAYNYFVIVGPPGDPAGIAGMDPVEAFRRLAESGEAPFVSRGDDSGTHGREKSIWAAAGFDYEAVRASGDWYVEAGCGMGPALVMADEKGAYTLSDLGTFSSYRGDLSLVPLVTGGDALLNVYSAIVVTSTPEPFLARRLVEFLVSDEVQELIGTYGVEECGVQLFVPCAGAEPEVK